MADYNINITFDSDTNTVSISGYAPYKTCMDMLAKAVEVTLDTYSELISLDSDPEIEMQRFSDTVLRGGPYNG